MGTGNAKRRYISTEEKKELVAGLVYYVQVEGKTQMQAAELVGVSEKTASHWLREIHCSKGKKNGRALQSNETKQYVESIYGFILYAKRKSPAIYLELQTLYKDYLKAI